MIAPVIPSAPSSARSLTDRGSVALAGAVGAGAWWHWAVPLWFAGLAVLLAVAARRPTLLVVGGFLLAAAVGARSMDGMGAVTPAPYEGTVTLVTDPRETPFGARVDVRVDRDVPWADVPRN